MTTGNDDFATLLRDAPMAPNTDTVTIVGILGRTHDPAHFGLTLPDGRFETLPVDAVKSARKMAGAIGQSVVELELDAKRVPERLLEIARLTGDFNPFIPTGGGPWEGGWPWPHPHPTWWGAYEPQPFPMGAYKPEPQPWLGAYKPQPFPWLDAYRPSPQPWLGDFAPFVAAMPHHVHPATLAALERLSTSRTQMFQYPYSVDRITKHIPTDS